MGAGAADDPEVCAGFKEKGVMASGYELYNWAWGVEGLKQGELMVLLALVSYADKKGECFPSRKALAARARCSVERLAKHLKVLKEAGLVEVVTRYSPATGEKISSLYRLKFSSTTLVDSPVDK